MNTLIAFPFAACSKRSQAITGVKSRIQSCENVHRYNHRRRNVNNSSIDESEPLPLSKVIAFVDFRLEVLEHAALGIEMLLITRTDYDGLGHFREQ